jgi:hypothetical protein
MLYINTLINATMKSDVNGCSTTVAGQEKYESFSVRGKSFYQYDYRTESGRLFSCVRPSLEKCRAALAVWMVTNNYN